MMKQNWVKKADAASQAILATSIITMGFISLASLLAIPTHADDNTDVVDIVNITVPTACTMGGTIVTGQEHSTSMQPGTYEANIGKTTLTTYCNDPDGFSIYAIGFTGDQYSGTNHTKLVGNNANNTISTGLTTGSSTTDASSWAMKLTAVTGTYAPTIMNGTGGTENFTNYHVVPDTYTKVATFPSTTDAEGVGSTGSSLETTYAVYASLSQPADTYTGKVKYVLVHPSSFAAGNYSIVYNTNGGTGTNVTVNNIANYEPYTIAANTFTAPSGYQFAGWCTIQDNTQSPQTSCAGGTLYQPDDIATSLASAGGTFNLYATWSKLLTLADATSMQDLASNDYCTSTTIGDTATLTDSRDGASYTVGKLADGKCWMLDNLALDLTSSTVLNAMSESNTNASSTTLGYLKNGGGTTSDKYAITGVVNWTDSPTYASSYSYSDPLVNMASKDVVPSDATSTAGGYKIGGYYNYCAASAGSYCYGNGTSYGTSSGNATESICPAGWRMPTGNTSGEYSALANAIYGSTSSTSDATAYANYRSALHLPLSGYYYNGSASNQGGHGYWWSSTRHNSYNGMYVLYASTSTINPASYSGRGSGFSLRCVAGS